MSDIVTILVGDSNADGYKGLYVKKYDSNKRELSVSKPKQHRVKQRSVSSLQDLKKVILEEGRHPERCIIRGRLTDEAREAPGLTRRRLSDFEDVAHHWVMFDMDSVTAPQSASDWQGNPDATIRATIREHLPDEFHDAPVFWRWSNSMGIKPGIRVHLWFWLAEPQTSEQVVRYIYSHGYKTDKNNRKKPIFPVDLAIYRTVQPHIIAPPIIGRRADGYTPRPIAGKRHGLLPGLHGVEEVALSEGIIAVANDIWDIHTDTSSGDKVIHREKADRDSPIGFVNAAIPIEDALEDRGYLQVTPDRWLYPNSTSGTPGVVVDRNGHCMSFHGDDPLADGKPHDAFDIMMLPVDPDESDPIPEIDRKQAVFDFAVQQVLQDMNRKHALIHNTSTVRVLTERPHPEYSTQCQFSYINIDGLKQFYANQPVFNHSIGIDKSGERISTYKKTNIVPQWVHWPDRRTYEGLTFRPIDLSVKHPELFNEWTGWPIKPRQGNKCAKFLELIRFGLCNNNAAHYEWVLDWMADALQDPENRPGTAIVLQGDKGLGKGQFAEHFGALFGKHYMQIASSKHLLGNFNAHLADKLLVFMDEALWGGDKASEGVLQTLITEHRMVLERKGVDATEGRNYCRIIIASNHSWVIPTGGNERRYFMLPVCDKYRDDYAFFAALNYEMRDGGYAALAHMLMERQYSKDTLRRAPKTEALFSQYEMNMDPVDQWLMVRVAEGRMLRDVFDDEFGQQRTGVFINGSPWPSEVYMGAVHDDYVRFFANSRHRGQPLTRRAFAERIKRLMQSIDYEFENRVVRVSKYETLRYYKWPEPDMWHRALRTIGGYDHLMDNLTDITMHYHAPEEEGALDFLSDDLDFLR